MPVQCRNRSCRSRRNATRFSPPVRLPPPDPQQGNHPTQQVKAMRRGKNVKKADTGIRNQIEACRHELTPGQKLAAKETNPQDRSCCPPPRKTALSSRLEHASR